MIVLQIFAVFFFMAVVQAICERGDKKPRFDDTLLDDYVPKGHGPY